MPGPPCCARWDWDGLRALIERHCAQARRMADRLPNPSLRILNDVVLNQVLCASRTAVEMPMG